MRKPTPREGWQSTWWAHLPPSLWSDSASWHRYVPVRILDAKKHSRLPDDQQIGPRHEKPAKKMFKRASVHKKCKLYPRQRSSERYTTELINWRTSKTKVPLVFLQRCVLSGCAINNDVLHWKMQPFFRETKSNVRCMQICVSLNYNSAAECD